MTVSPKSASKGDTVTVTVKPDSGYVLETLTVTDKNGNELTLKDKGNGKYTFTMPAGKVEVKATFMEDNSMLNFFYDVPNNAYFYEAVKWAVKNGITDRRGQRPVRSRAALHPRADRDLPVARRRLSRAEGRCVRHDRRGQRQLL